MSKTPLACAIGLASLLASVQATSAERHAGPAGRRFVGTPELAARSYLTEYAGALRISGAQLTRASTLPVFGSSTVRFGQQHRGLPVFGAAVAVRVTGSGEVKAAVVDLARDLSVSATPGVDEASARGLVRQYSGHDAGLGVWTELGIKPDRRGGKLVWRVNVPTNDGAVRYEVDAHSGALLRQYPLAKDVKGRVYEVNNLKTPNPVDVELLNLTPSDPQILARQQALVGRYVSGDLEAQPPKPLVLDPQAVTPDENGDFLYDPVTKWAWDDAFTEVNVYYHMDRMHSFFTGGLGLDMTSSKYRLVVVPHYGPNKQPYPNAFYTPYTHKQDGTTYYHGIFLGGTAGYNFAYDSDVFLHEYVHFVNHNAIGFSEGPYQFDDYGLATMPGSLDEGSADYFSSTVNDDPVVGEAALKGQSRDLDRLPGKCPDSLFGETHEDGQLMGTAGWAVRKVLGAERADPLIWGAMQLLTTSCTLGDFHDNVMLGLDELKASGQATDQEIEQVAAAMRARGLDDCKRFLSLDEGKSRVTNLLGLELIAMYMGGSCKLLRDTYGFELTSLFHFSYAVKSTDKAVRFKVDLTPLGSSSNEWNWDIYVRAGDGTTFQTSLMGMGDPDQFDHAVTHITQPKGELVIDGSSQPPLDPTATYYMVILQRNCPTAQALVSVVTEQEPADAGTDVEEPEAGPEQDAGPDAGQPAVNNGTDTTVGGGACACRAAGHGGASRGALLFAAAALAAARRRRARAVS
jgi:Zn-dependent metalloprotease